jgi:hypothetical protein
MIRSVQLTAVLGIVCMGSVVDGALAAEFRSRPPHVHGLATLDIAVDGAELAITFRAPAINVIGFEHAPSTPDEKSAVAHADQTFKAGDHLFVTPAEAGCTQRSADLTPITYETEGDDDKPNAPQADYEVTYRFECAHAGKLAWIDTTLFASLRNAQKISVNIVSDRLQTQITLIPGQRHISLQPE